MPRPHIHIQMALFRFNIDGIMSVTQDFTLYISVLLPLTALFIAYHDTNGED